jgi:hypothetical protein
VPSWSKSVYSSLLSEVGWDEANQELTVTFAKNGKTAAYKGFDEGKATELSHAPSAGSMFLHEIKPFASAWRYV